MGKRSDFKRIERDAYNTPLGAALPLLTLLESATRFIEPCVGEGDLRSHLEAAGHPLRRRLRLSFPRRPLCRLQHSRGRDLRHQSSVLGPARKPASLDRQPRESGTGLAVMNANWLHNKSSAAVMPRLKTIVSVGRVRWIVGSPYTSKDDVAWMLFGTQDGSPIRFIGRSP
jgi:hypothetical protein